MTVRKKWLYTYLLIGFAQIFAVLFPLAWVLRGLKKWNPLWFVLDDTRLQEDGSYAEDYRIFLNGFKYRWIGVLAWHTTRNRVWNFTELFKVPKGDLTVGNQSITITKLIKDELTDGFGNKKDQGGPYTISAGLKYVGEPGDNPWQVNRGDIIAKKYSIIGEGEIEFTVNGTDWKGWRKTSCVLKKCWYLFGATRWVTVFKGMNGNRYSFKWKHQKDKPQL